MPLRYVLDENLRGSLWDIIQRHNLAGEDRLDAVRVGDRPELPLGTLDPELLLWAEREDRLLISSDKKTMARHLADHLGAGHHSPGIMTLRGHAFAAHSRISGVGGICELAAQMARSD